MKDLHKILLWSLCQREDFVGLTIIVFWLFGILWVFKSVNVNNNGQIRSDDGFCDKSEAAKGSNDGSPLDSSLVPSSEPILPA